VNDQRIIFMGTPAFATGVLDALVENGIGVAGVVTAPDKPAGRGRAPRPSAVKQRAIELGLPVLQPERLKDPAFHTELDRIDASLYVVVAFRMLPEAVWARPPLGTVNLHASLLPDYRGAAPINWAIANGERRTGLTTFLLKHEIDTGDILLQEEMAIGPDETFGELHDRMMAAGAALMVRTVHGLFHGSLVPRPQIVHGPLRTAPRIGPDDLHVDAARTARRTHDLVRGMSPLPGMWCQLHGEGAAPLRLKVLRTRTTGEPAGEAPGTVRTGGGRLLFACADEWLEAVEVQPEGKRRMTAGEFVRGLRGGAGHRIA